MNSNKSLWIAVVVVAIIAVGGYFFPQVAQLLNLGRVGTQMPNGVTIGSSGTNNRNVIDGTCTLIVQAGTQVASTTAPYDCAVTGLTSSFTSTLAQFSTSTAFTTSQAFGFVIVGSKASTTAGYLTVLLLNATGAAANASTLGYASTTSYHAVQTQ